MQKYHTIKKLRHYSEYSCHLCAETSIKNTKLFWNIYRILFYSARSYSVFVWPHAPILCFTLQVVTKLLVTHLHQPLQITQHILCSSNSFLEGLFLEWTCTCFHSHQVRAARNGGRNSKDWGASVARKVRAAVVWVLVCVWWWDGLVHLEPTSTRSVVGSQYTGLGLLQVYQSPRMGYLHVCRYHIH